MAGWVEGFVTARGIDVFISTLRYLKKIYISNFGENFPDDKSYYPHKT